MKQASPIEAPPNNGTTSEGVTQWLDGGTMHIRHWLVFVVSPQTRPNCDCVTQSPDFNAAQVCAAFTDDLRTAITACLFSTTCLLLSTFSHLPFPLNRVASPEGMPSAPTFSRHLPPYTSSVPFVAFSSLLQSSFAYSMGLLFYNVPNAIKMHSRCTS